MTGLVGRSEEIARIRAAIDAAAAGRGSSLLVVGEVGIGKSALLDAAADLAAPSMDVVAARGIETERDLPFSVLATLASPLLLHVDALPTPQARALRAALAIEDAPAVDPLAVASATHGLLAASGEAQPLLVLVDDAHWIDHASAAALLFAARRLESVRVAIVMAARTGEPGPLGLETLPTLQLDGLDVGEAAALLEVPLARAHELVAWTRGNPLALLELREAPLDVAVPPAIGDELIAVFARRVEALPEASRTALLRAAVDEHLRPEDVEALAPAERAALVLLRLGRCVFRHPLVRAAAYHSAPDADRRRAHADVAAAIVDDPARRALHLAHAAAAPDEDVASALDAAAGAAAARGGVAEAARMLELAARLTPGGESRARRLAAAARARLTAGDADAAEKLASEAATSIADDAATVADVELARGLVAMWRGRPLDAHSLLANAAERVAPEQPNLASNLYATAVQPVLTAGRPLVALEAARRALALAGDDAFLRTQAEAVFVHAATLTGDVGPRPRAVERIVALLEHERPVAPLVPGVGLALVWLEEYGPAAALLSETIAATRDSGATMTLPFLLSAWSELRWWQGDLRAATAGAVEAAAIYDSVGAHIARPYTLALLARFAAAQGDERAARTYAEEAIASARPFGVESIEVYAASALGLLELTLGRANGALAALSPLRGFYDERGITEPNAIPWLGDLAEAAAAAGEQDVYADALRRLDAAAASTGSAWAAGVAARARALAASDGDAETYFVRAAELLERVPFELARTDLAHGTVLRRQRKKSAARTRLRAAAEAFAQMGAAPWVDHATAELAAAGERRIAPANPIERILSPQELRVALLVREGATNRDIAARLFLSPKTVEYHLGNAFRKLDVSSRTQLATRLQGADSD